MYVVSYLTNTSIKNRKQHSLPNWDLQNIVIWSFIPWAVAILTFTFHLLSCEDIQGVKSRRWSTDYVIWLTSCYWMTYRFRNMILKQYNVINQSLLSVNGSTISLPELHPALLAKKNWPQFLLPGISFDFDWTLKSNHFFGLDRN